MKTKKNNNDFKGQIPYPGVRLTLIVAGIVFQQVAWFIAALAVSVIIYVVAAIMGAILMQQEKQIPKKKVKRTVGYENN